jgi:nucleotide-binding universal stress UspA family protein
MALEESELGIAEPRTRSSASPVHDDAPFHRVLIPLDGSSVAESVLPYARRLAGGGSHLILVQVVTPTPVAAALEAPASAQIIAEADERARVDAQAYLERMSDRLRRDGREVTALVLLGDPATVITNVAREHAVELIAMTTHGRTGLSRLMFGSVAEHVLRHAPVPVFLVRVAEEAEARRAA